MEYDKYIELFSEASNVNIEDLLEPDLYRRITQAFERNYYNSIKKEFIDKMFGQLIVDKLTTIDIVVSYDKSAEPKTIFLLEEYQSASGSPFRGSA